MNERTEGSGKRPDGRGRKIRQGSQGARGSRTRAIAGEAARFWAKVERADNGCLLRNGATTNGYGRFRVWRNGRWTHIRAHRWAYEDVHGPIPDGIYLDHKCHTQDLTCPGGPTCLHRRCVDETHLEPVDDEENRRRARARRKP
jgi:hypothetical protein